MEVWRRASGFLLVTEKFSSRCSSLRPSSRATVERYSTRRPRRSREPSDGLRWTWSRSWNLRGRRRRHHPSAPVDGRVTPPSWLVSVRRNGNGELNVPPSHSDILSFKPPANSSLPVHHPALNPSLPCLFMSLRAEEEESLNYRIYWTMRCTRNSGLLLASSSSVPLIQNSLPNPSLPFLTCPNPS